MQHRYLWYLDHQEGSQNGQRNLYWILKQHRVVVLIKLPHHSKGQTPQSSSHNSKCWEKKLFGFNKWQKKTPKLGWGICQCQCNRMPSHQQARIGWWLLEPVIHIHWKGQGSAAWLFSRATSNLVGLKKGGSPVPQVGGVLKVGCDCRLGCILQGGQASQFEIKTSCYIYFVACTVLENTSKRGPGHASRVNFTVNERNT